MEFFDKLSETIVSAGKDVGQKAKDVSEIAKLKMDIRSKEDFVEKQYAEIGKAYYEKHKDEENAETEEKTPEHSQVVSGRSGRRSFALFCSLVSGVRSSSSRRSRLACGGIHPHHDRA